MQDLEEKYLRLLEERKASIKATAKRTGAVCTLDFVPAPETWQLGGVSLGYVFAEMRDCIFDAAAWTKDFTDRAIEDIAEGVLQRMQDMGIIACTGGHCTGISCGSSGACECDEEDGWWRGLREDASPSYGGECRHCGLPDEYQEKGDDGKICCGMCFAKGRK